MVDIRWGMALPLLLAAMPVQASAGGSNVLAIKVRVHVPLACSIDAQRLPRCNSARVRPQQAVQVVRTERSGPVEVRTVAPW